jgi:hypothetical protein
MIPLTEQNPRSTWLYIYCTEYADGKQQQEQENKKKRTPTYPLATDEEERIHNHEKFLAEIIK